MSFFKQLIFTILIVLGLVALLAFERSISLPIFFMYASLVVMTKTSPALQASLAVILGFFLAVIYILPLWLGVAILATGFLLQARVRSRLLVVAVSQLVIFMIAGMKLTTVLIWTLGLELGLVLAIFGLGFGWHLVSRRFYLSRRLL